MVMAFYNCVYVNCCIPIDPYTTILNQKARPHGEMSPGIDAAREPGRPAVPKSKPWPHLLINGRYLKAFWTIKTVHVHVVLLFLKLLINSEIVWSQSMFHNFYTTLVWWHCFLSRLSYSLSTGSKKLSNEFWVYHRSCVIHYLSMVMTVATNYLLFVLKLDMQVASLEKLYKISERC
jgi:hypothetical protein